MAVVHTLLCALFAVVLPVSLAACAGLRWSARAGRDLARRPPRRPPKE